MLSGLQVTQYRERDQLIEVLARGVPDERKRSEELKNFNIATQSGRWVPLTQVATIEYDFEEPIIWRRTRMPTLTVQADVHGDIQAPVVSMQIDPQLVAIRTGLTPEYRLDVGGAIEESAKGQESVNAVVPLMLLVVITLLMVHLQNFSKAVIVLLTAPLG
ncbi:MAG: efflux RND transporter permease subunit, partial [Betaproteobacteria bacterium]|nr:efflux RND transporter permease subunit [Betaproteobacteria bacterium]